MATRLTPLMDASSFPAADSLGGTVALGGLLALGVAGALTALAGLSFLGLSAVGVPGFPGANPGRPALTAPAPAPAPETLAKTPAAHAVAVVPAIARPAEAPYPYGDEIAEAGDRFSVNPSLIAAIIRLESEFHAREVSPTGAVGLMQVEPSVAALIARHLGMRHYNLFDPRTNVIIGTCHLAGLIKEFQGDLPAVLSYYNGGRRSMVARGIYRNPRYIHIVLRNYHMYQRLSVNRGYRLAMLQR